jgi:hypothetical protein
MSSLRAIPCCPQTVLPPVPDTTRRRKKTSATLRSIWSKDGVGSKNTSGANQGMDLSRNRFGLSNC